MSLAQKPTKKIMKPIPPPKNKHAAAVLDISTIKITGNRLVGKNLPDIIK